MTMSDTVTYLTIHACPPHRVRAVATALEDHWLVDVDGSARKTLQIGEPYTIDTSEVDELADDLIETAPEMSFTAQTDPTDEWLGSLRRYVPALHRFEASCDHDGSAVFTTAQVRELDLLAPEARLARLGVPWSTAIEAMPTGDVIEPEPYATCWIPSTGEITVLAAGPDGADVGVTPACVTAVDDDGNLASSAAADAALAGCGFLRVNAWEALNATCRAWGTDVYWTTDNTDASTAPAPA